MTVEELTSGTLTATTARLQAAFTGCICSSPEGSLAYVFLGDRWIWIFLIGKEHWDPVSKTLDIDWPAVLVPRLSGVATARVEVRAGADSPATLLAEGDLEFDGSRGKLALIDRLSGDGLVVDKWGRLAKSFEPADQGKQIEILQSTQEVVALLKKTLGLELFITGGTLLGLVRDGKLINSDDDADLAYLSKHGNPSDIVLESYEVERVLTENGLDSVRHSSGHLQVMFGGDAYTDGYYMDIFSHFVVEGWFYGTFHAREKAADVTVFLLGELEHEGLKLPIPANTDQVLSSIYGAQWKTPDPAFTFVTPESAAVLLKAK